MLMLPLPAFVALVLGYLAIRSFAFGERPMIGVFLSACAMQALAVALVGGYYIDALRPVLPVSATLIPALAWITFRTSLYAQSKPRDIALHLTAPLFTLFCRVFAPQTLDVVVLMIFLGYGAAILLRLRNSSDVPLARLDAGELTTVIWKTLGWVLIAS
ncbi:MAG: AraC family transcriptional regulator, partial [Deltaproteobacteria bacterium]